VARRPQDEPKVRLSGRRSNRYYWGIPFLWLGLGRRVLTNRRCVGRGARRRLIPALYSSAVRVADVRQGRGQPICAHLRRAHICCFILTAGQRGRSASRALVLLLSSRASRAGGNQGFPAFVAGRCLPCSGQGPHVWTGVGPALAGVVPLGPFPKVPPLSTGCGGQCPRL
jgi:hypothetical protein